MTENTGEQPIKERLALLLTTLHANEVSSVGLKQIRQSLEAAGYYVTKKWIEMNAKQIGIVKDVDDTRIHLEIESDETEPEAEKPKDEEKTVEKMAKKALQRRKG